MDSGLDWNVDASIGFDLIIALSAFRSAIDDYLRPAERIHCSKCNLKGEVPYDLFQVAALPFEGVLP